MKRLCGLVLALLLLASPAYADFDEGVAAYNRGDYATALREFRPLAEQGHAKAQYSLGRMYHLGRGVPQDYVEAVKWFRAAAEQGHAFAQQNLGIGYLNGQGVLQDYVLAYMWFNLAAVRGNKISAGYRDLTAKLMTPEQIAEAQRLAREWKPTK
jgi:hypothetical protein